MRQRRAASTGIAILAHGPRPVAWRRQLDGLNLTPECVGLEGLGMDSRLEDVQELALKRPMMTCRALSQRVCNCSETFLMDRLTAIVVPL